MRSIHRFLAAIAACLGLASHASQYTDVWFNPQEPGWGVNIVQQLETAFVTLYVYGPDGKPLWYVASDARITAYSEPGAYPLFQGALYKTTGAWHGGPHAPGTVTKVGELSLEVLARDRIRVHYTAEGVTAVKEVRRFTWAQPVVAGNYVAQAMLRQAVPGGAPYGTLYMQADLLLHLNEENGQGFMRLDDQFGRRCEYRGPYQQAGKLIRFAGAYTCNTGDSRAGTFELTDVEVSANGLNGYLRLFAANLNQYGRFSALQQ